MASSVKKRGKLPNTPKATAASSEPAAENTMLVAALAFIERGWPIVPVPAVDSAGHCTCALGAACKDIGKHPAKRGGPFWRAEIAREFWSRPGNANCGVALATGAFGADAHCEGFLTLDVDGPKGRASLAALEAEHGPLPVTMTTRTGRPDGGEQRHFVVRERVKSRVGLRLGLDTRGQGGLALLPPSRYKGTDRTYSWIVPPPTIALAPQWLVDLVRKDRPAPQPAARNAQRAPAARVDVGATPALDAVDGQPEPGREVRIFLAACSDRGRGADDEAIYNGCRAAAARCVPPLDDASTDKAITSACEYPRGTGRPAGTLVLDCLIRLHPTAATVFLACYGRRKSADDTIGIKGKAKPLRVARGEAWVTHTVIAKQAGLSTKQAGRWLGVLRDVGMVDWRDAMGCGLVVSFPVCNVQPDSASKSAPVAARKGVARPAMSNLTPPDVQPDPGGFVNDSRVLRLVVPVPMSDTPSLPPAPVPSGGVRPPTTRGSHVGPTTTAPARPRRSGAKATALDRARVRGVPLTPIAPETVQ